MQNFPRLGLGTYLSPDDQLTTEAVRCAIEEGGYRHIDCAWAYFNEESVGKALQDVLKRKIVKREEIWVTSKLWNTAHHPEDVEAQCRDTLKKLQLEYLDLYLIHWPCAFQKVKGEAFPMENGKAMIDENVTILDTWKAMESLVEKGLVKRIGVSNFSIELLEKMRYSTEVKIQPYTNQVECHLYMQQNALVEYCKARNIIITTYQSLGAPGSDHPGKPKLLEDEELIAISKEIGQPVGKVAIKFLQQMSPNTVVLVKSLNPERIKSNNDLQFELTEEQMKRLRKRERCMRYYNMKQLWGVELWGESW